MDIFSWFTNIEDWEKEKVKSKDIIMWENIILEEIENIFYNELKNEKEKEIWNFSYENLERLKIWELRYFLRNIESPLTLRCVSKSTPYTENNYEIIDLFNCPIKPNLWKIGWIVWRKEVIEVTKKAFYKRVLYWMYNCKFNEILFEWERTHENLIELDRVTEKKRYLYMPSDIKKNELEGHTVEELEKIVDLEEVKTNGVIRKNFNKVLDFNDMKVWETWYFQYDSGSFLIRRTKKSPLKKNIYGYYKYVEDDFESLQYSLWINNPFFRLWISKCIWTRKEVWYISQMYFYMYVLYNEYRYRMSMLSRLANKTQEELEKIEEYKRRMHLYDFRDYY